MSAAGQAMHQKNPGAVVAAIRQLDWMRGLGINSQRGYSVHRRPTEFLHFLSSVCVFSGLLGWRIQIRRVMHDPPFLWAVSRNCPYVSSEVAVPIVSGLLREAPTEHSVPDLRLLPCRFLQTFSALEMSERQNRSASSSRNLKKNRDAFLQRSHPSR